MWGHIGHRSVSRPIPLLLLILGTWSCSEAHIKLNVPRVRLPYFDTISVNFTLEVETPGCYQWSVTRPDIISMTSTDSYYYDQDGTECSSRVMISAGPRVSPCCPASAIVYVEDRVTKEVVRCDVIIDKIVGITIETTTKELHMEEAPSKFYVEAHGSKGDKFSTVDGVPFRWWLEPVGDTTTDPQSIMRFMSFSESTYQAPPGVAALEARRLQGSTILVEGLKTGSARVFAKLTDPSYKNVPPAEVRIVVVANLQVDPREAYIVPDTQIPLRLRQIRHGKLTEIPLPSKTYSFEVTNTSVISYDPKTSTITALNYGSSDIIVRDRNALSDTLDTEHPEGLIAHIYVREPRFLALTVTPYRNWALQIGKEYEIQVDIYDEENQKIYISDNILVETTFDPSYFRVDSSTANGTHHVGVPIRTGSAPVVAELKHLKKLDGSLVEPATPVRVKTDMEIFQAVVIHPKETVLPWDPNLKPKHEIRLTASGGNGNFFWTTTNTSVVTVTQGGVARSENLGFANVTASMTINNQIKGHAKIYILPPTSMMILDHNVEAEVGVPILVPLAFYTIRPDDPSKTPVPYSNCHEFPFQVTVEDPLFKYDEKTFYPPAKPACAYLPIIGSALGSSVVTVTYRIKDLVFTDSVTVSTFKPLKVVEPPSQLTVLAVGSSRQLAFEGGPRPLLEKHGFYRAIDISNRTVAKTSELKVDTGKDDLYVYRVLCQEIGETIVTLEVGNKPKQAKNARAVLRVAEVKVICAEPAQIYFKVETSLKAGGSKCPSDTLGAQVTRVAVPNYENSRVVVTVKDINGRKFDNITSLHIKWTTSPPLASVKTEGWVETEAVELIGYETVGSSYQTIIPRGLPGNMELKAEVLGYRRDILAKEGIKGDRALAVPDPEWAEILLSERAHSMELQLVGDVRAEPAQLSLFNHAASKSVVKILEGSGYFEYELVGEGVVNVNYFESNKTLEITPLTEGNVRVIVRDLCLTPRKQAEIDVQVNGIGSVEIIAADKVQIDHEVNVSVVIYDKAGQLIPPAMVPMIRLKLSPVDAGIAEVTRLEITDEDKRKSRRRFVLKGVGVGQVTLSFTADGPGRVVRSEAKRISVFAPLTLLPKNVTLLVGSVYQVQALGGPQPDTNIVYRVKDRQLQDIASVTPTGVIQGRKVGETRVTVQSVDRAAESLVYSEDSVAVRVIPLGGIRIQAPLTRIQSQKEMPLYIMGLGEGLEPTVLVGDRKSLLSAEWSYNNHESADLIHPFQENGYVPELGDQLSIRFKAKQPGRVTVKVFVVFNREQHMDEIEIEIVAAVEAYAMHYKDLQPRILSDVYDELKFVKVPCGCQNLLMTPRSELNLRTNRDPSAKITYSVQPTKPGTCVAGTDCQRMVEKPVVTMDSNGIVRSNDVAGQAVITVSVLEDFGVSLSISVTIDVKPVSYLMITPRLPVTLTSHDTPSIPRGISFPFTVSYHDNIGRAFDATQATPRLRANRLDLVQLSSTAENNTFVAQATHEGRVCIKVYDRTNPQISDFLVLNVGEAIEPKLPMGVVTVGDIICFSCVIKSKSFRNGYWVADPAGPIQIDASTGMTAAVTPGAVRIEYTIPNVGVVTSVELNVVGIDQIKFETAGVPKALTNGDPNYVYDILVNFGEKKNNLLASTNCFEEFTSRVIPPFSCSLGFESRDVISRPFTVRPVFVFSKRQYACRISVIEDEVDDFNLSLINSDLLLSAHVNPSAIHSMQGSFGREVRTDDLRFAFYPALTLHTKELTVWSNDLYVGAELKITGSPSLLDRIQVAPSDATSLRVEGLHTRGRFLPYLPEIGGGQKALKADVVKHETRTYAVYVQSDFWHKAEFDDRLKLSVSVLSPATHQQFTVPVKIKFRPPFAEPPYNLRTWSGLLTYFASQAQTWFFTPLLYFVVTLIAAQLCYRSFVTVRSKAQKDAEPSVAVFKSRSDLDQSFGSKSQVFRDLTSRSSSASPVSSPFSSYPGGGGDTSQSPLGSSASTPVRSRLFSAPDDPYFSSPYRRSTPR